MLSIATTTDSLSTFLSAYPCMAEPIPTPEGALFMRKSFPNVIEPGFLFLGNRRMAYDEDIVRALGFTHIVDCHDTDVPPAEPHRESLGVTYLNVRVDDEPSADISPHLTT